MTILVSGGAGFVGGAISRHLLQSGQSVRVMSRSMARARKKYENTELGRAALSEGRLTLVEADVTNATTLIPAVRGVDAVIQAAQFPGAPVEDPSRGLTYMNVDRNGTLNLLGALAQVYGEPTAGPTMARFPDSAPRFLYMSGISVTEASTFAWDRAKWQAEQAIQGSGLDWTIVRSSWLFGPDDVALNRLIGYSDYLPFVPLFGDGQAPLTPLYVEDLGRLFAAMMEGPEMSVDTLFKVGGPDEVTLNEFLHLAIRARGRRRPLLHIPMPVGKIQGAIMRHFPGRPLTPDAVDFVAQAGAVGADDRKFLAERFPTFAPTPLGSALGSYLGV